MKAKLHEVAKVGYKNFSEGTHMHGFVEIYESESKFWKFVWTLIVIASSAVTIYQVTETLMQYLKENVSTEIQIVSSDQIHYPPLKLCYSHWLYWVDFDKAAKMGIEKNVLLYGLSYLTTIYVYGTKSNVDVAKDGIEFNKTMNDKGFKTLSKLFLSVVRQPSWTTADDTYKLFDTKELFVAADNSLLMCHVASSENMKQYMSDFWSQNNILSITLDDFDFQKFFPNNSISQKEYSRYIAEWMYLRRNKDNVDVETKSTAILDKSVSDFSQISAPMFLFVDGYSNEGIQVNADVEEYFINVKSSLHVWVNRRKHACVEDKVAAASDQSQYSYCSYLSKYPKQDGDNCNLYYAAFAISKDFSYSTCRNTFVFEYANGSVEEVWSGIAERNQINDNEDVYNQCAKKIEAGCVEWNYDIVTSTLTVNDTGKDGEKKNKNETVVEIKFVVDSSVVGMIEVELQTWQNFVGNVGGVLGIWTGASILSFVQLFHLCCVAEHETKLSRSMQKLMKRKVAMVKRNRGISVIKSKNDVSVVQSANILNVPPIEEIKQDLQETNCVLSTYSNN